MARKTRCNANKDIAQAQLIVNETTLQSHHHSMRGW